MNPLHNFNFCNKEIQTKHLKDLYNKNQKTELYVCSDEHTLKYLIENDKLDLFEECSAPGYGWTCLHYACSKGLVDGIFFFFVK